MHWAHDGHPNSSANPDYPMMSLWCPMEPHRKSCFMQHENHLTPTWLLMSLRFCHPAEPKATSLVLLYIMLGNWTHPGSLATPWDRRWKWAAWQSLPLYFLSRQADSYLPLHPQIRSTSRGSGRALGVNPCWKETHIHSHTPQKPALWTHLKLKCENFHRSWFEGK